MWKLVIVTWAGRVEGVVEPLAGVVILMVEPGAVSCLRAGGGLSPSNGAVWLGADPPQRGSRIAVVAAVARLSMAREQTATPGAALRLRVWRTVCTGGVCWAGGRGVVGSVVIDRAVPVGCKSQVLAPRMR